jgi:uncharacterized protein YjbI with pentapeptide repeats
MTDQGKYHGQRLKAKDVLRLYAAGERDFSGAILRGCNFRGADLSGADFSRADIKGSNFTDTTLTSSKFNSVTAGIQTHWKIGLMAVGCLISFVLNIFTGLFYSLPILVLSEPSIVRGYTLVIIGLHVMAIILIAILIQKYKFTEKALYISFSLFIGICILFLLLTLNSIFLRTIGLSLLYLSLLAIFGLFCSIIVNAIFMTYTAMVDGSKTFWLTPIMIGIFSIYTVLYSVLNLLETEISGEISLLSVSVAVTVSVVVISLGAYSSLCALSLQEGFYFIQRAASFFSRYGGTRFSGADLTDAHFAYANLLNTDFSSSQDRETTATRVRWKGALRLETAHLGKLILRNSKVRNLITSFLTADKDFSGHDLRGANLAGANLGQINFRGADLSEGTFAEANLQGANLTEAQCIGIDFTATQLTGACLEAWNIDETTVLKDIDCQYVFLKEHPDARGNRERRPHDPDKVFQPGDFEKFFKEMLDTVQILIRNGVDPRAFQAAFEKVMTEHPEITRDSIQAIEKQGEDVLLTLQVPEGTDKGKVERTWDEGYQLGLREGYKSGLLEGQTQRADDVKEVALGFSQLLSSIQITNMNNPINTGEGSFYAGRDVNLAGSNINLGEISGQVTNQINQLPDESSKADRPNLKDLLTQLKEAVETDAELSDAEKAEALGEVAKLAQAGSNPQEGAMSRIAKRATNTLKSIAETLSDTSKLATACKTLLPMIATLF